MTQEELAYKKGFPANLEAERFTLGSILLEDSNFVMVAGLLEPDDFSIEKHKRIFQRMVEIFEKGERIDRVTVAEALMKQGMLESVDGLSYLVSLDDGLPHIANLESYVRIVKDKSVLRRLIFSSQKLIEQCFLGVEESSQIISNAQENLFKIAGVGKSDTLIDCATIINNFEGGINSFLDPSKRPHGVKTGFYKLDEMTDGFRGGDLIILAGRPSMGKTALAVNIGQHVATRAKGTVAIFSLEMSRESLLTRMICAAGRVDQQKFRAGYLNQDENRQLLAAATELSKAPLFIDDTSGSNIMEIHSRLRKLKAEKGLALVIIDYLQLMKGNGKFQNQNAEVSNLSRNSKLMAKDLDVPIIMLSQLSRAPENRKGDHKPQLSDLRDSGSIEQDADIVALIFREEVYNQNREDLKGQADLILAKQRQGPIGTVNLFFLKHCTKFENPARFDEEPQG